MNSTFESEITFLGHMKMDCCFGIWPPTPCIEGQPFSRLPSITRMPRGPNIRAERIAMQERVRMQRLRSRGFCRPRVLMADFSAIVCHAPHPTPLEATNPGEHGMRRPTPRAPKTHAMLEHVRGKLEEVKQKQELAAAVDGFTLQHGRNSAELKGTEFEGGYHLDLILSFHPMEYLAECLAPPDAKVEAENWLKVMNAAFACCPLSPTTQWCYGNTLGMLSFKSHVRRVMAMLECPPAK